MTIDTQALPHDGSTFEHRSLPEAIYLTMRDAILDGRYRPGEALRQETLAQQFDVSRVPVREALGRLVAEGLVVLRPRRGYVVAPLNLEEIIEIFEMRMVVEEHAGRVATLVRTQEDVDELRQLLRALESTPATDPVNISKWAVINRTFHMRLFAASRRRHLCHVVNTYRDLVESYVRLEVSMTGDLDQARAEHRLIVEAFGQGDADLVGRLSREHCEHTAERLLEALRTREKDSQ